MSLQVRPGYINPLTAMRGNQPTKGRIGNMQEGKPDKLTELRTKQQSLQSEMLLIQSTGSDSSGNTSEKLKALKAKLEEVSTDLRTARTDNSRSTEKSMALRAKPDVDSYEKTEKESIRSGIYRLEADRENKHKVSFSPYSET